MGSLPSVTKSKLFTRILNNRLCKWAELYNAFVEAQGGVRAKMGTPDIIFVLHRSINQFINTSTRLYRALLILIRHMIVLNVLVYG